MTIKKISRIFGRTDSSLRRILTDLAPRKIAFFSEFELIDTEQQHETFRQK